MGGGAEAQAAFWGSLPHRADQPLPSLGMVLSGSSAVDWDPEALVEGLRGSDEAVSVAGHVSTVKCGI